MSGLILAGCGGGAGGGSGGGDGHAGHSHGEAGHKHEHKAPHGGTAVVLGKEEFHLELALDTAEGRMTAWILDGEMEKFVRVPAMSFEVAAVVKGVESPLVFQAVANAATGEKAGDTSQFEARAEWLKSTPAFEARLRSLTIRGKAYENVTFHFPKGNE